MHIREESMSCISALRPKMRVCFGQEGVEIKQEFGF